VVSLLVCKLNLDRLEILGDPSPVDFAEFSHVIRALDGYPDFVISLRQEHGFKGLAI
jgi:hypothetical protein